MISNMFRVFIVFFVVVNLVVSAFPVSIYTIYNFTSSTIPELNTTYTTNILPITNETTSDSHLIGGCISTTYGCCNLTEIQCADTVCSNCILYMDEYNEYIQ